MVNQDHKMENPSKGGTLEVMSKHTVHVKVLFLEHVYIHMECTRA